MGCCFTKLKLHTASQATATICVPIKARDLPEIFLIVRVQKKSAPSSLDPAHLLQVLPSCLQYTRTTLQMLGWNNTFLPTLHFWWSQFTSWYYVTKQTPELRTIHLLWKPHLWTVVIHQRGESIAHRQVTIRKPNRALNQYFSPNNYLKQDRWEAYTLKKRCKEPCSVPNIGIFDLSIRERKPNPFKNNYPKCSICTISVIQFGECTKTKGKSWAAVSSRCFTIAAEALRRCSNLR